MTVPDAVEPMLATPGTMPPPDDDRCNVEWKWDGYRACLRVGADGTCRYTSRGGQDLTATYPDLAAGPGPLGRPAVFDGEIVALDSAGVPDFALLQNAGAHRGPLSYFAFDVLLLGGHDLTGLPYTRRRALLDEITPADPARFTIPPTYAGGLTPSEMLDVAARHGLEGILLKDRASTYHPGKRSPAWRKYPLIRTQECVVGGWTPGQGNRAGTFGALLLGAHDADGALRYLGAVGTGFTDDALADLVRRLGRVARRTSPFADPVPADRARHAHWTDPALVGEVVYRRATPQGHLRHTAWRGLRPDIPPDAVGLPDQGHPG